MATKTLEARFEHLSVTEPEENDSLRTGSQIERDSKVGAEKKKWYSGIIVKRPWLIFLFSRRLELAVNSHVDGDVGPITTRSSSSQSQSQPQPDSRESPEKSSTDKQGVDGQCESRQFQTFAAGRGVDACSITDDDGSTY